MQQSTHIGDETLITPEFVRECIPYNPDYADILMSYRILVALVVYAHEHPDDDKLASLREFHPERIDSEWALTYLDFQSLYDAPRLGNLLLTYCTKLGRGPWSTSHGHNDHKRLAEEMKTLREHLERIYA